MTVTTPLGQVLRDEDGMRLEFVRTFDDPVEDVWAALTEPDRLAGWFGRWTGDPATGTIDLIMTAEEGATAQTVAVVTCEPPTRLVVITPSEDGPWHLSVTLQSEGGGTVLRFVHRLAEPYDASNLGPGWHYYLDRLGAVVAGDPVPGEWDDYYPSLQAAYALPI